MLDLDLFVPDLILLLGESLNLALLNFSLAEFGKWSPSFLSEFIVFSLS